MKFLPTRGVITFVFDDGYERVYKNVLPILNKHNMPGVFALPLDGSAVEKSERARENPFQPIRPWQEWLAIQHEGHEIASHSNTHPDLTTLTEHELNSEIAYPAQTLNATTFVYPGGGHNDTVVEATKAHYAAARTVLRGFETLPPKNPWRLKTFNFSRNNFTLLKANMFAVWAYLTNSWLIETYHMIHDDTSEMVHTVKTNDFKKHVAFIARLPIAVKTIKDITT